MILICINVILSINLQLQKVSDESVLLQIEKILGRIDDDRDGSIRVEDVLKVSFSFEMKKKINTIY